MRTRSEFIKAHQHLKRQRYLLIFWPTRIPVVRAECMLALVCTVCEKQWSIISRGWVARTSLFLYDSTALFPRFLLVIWSILAFAELLSTESRFCKSLSVLNWDFWQVLLQMYVQELQQTLERSHQTRFSSRYQKLVYFVFLGIFEFEFPRLPMEKMPNSAMVLNSYCCTGFFGCCNLDLIQEWILGLNHILNHYLNLNSRLQILIFLDTISFSDCWPSSPKK